MAELLLVIAFLCSPTTCIPDSKYNALMLTVEDCSVQRGWVNDVTYTNPDTSKVEFVIRYVPCVEH